MYLGMGIMPGILSLVQTDDAITPLVFYRVSIQPVLLSILPVSTGIVQERAHDDCALLFKPFLYNPSRSMPVTTASV